VFVSLKSIEAVEKSDGKRPRTGGGRLPSC
jgi:hypothetical protein